MIKQFPELLNRLKGVNEKLHKDYIVLICELHTKQESNKIIKKKLLKEILQLLLALIFMDVFIIKMKPNFVAPDICLGLMGFYTIIFIILICQRIKRMLKL